MEENNKSSIITRIIGLTGGLFGGAAIGFIFMIFFISLSGNAFGLNNIWPGIIFFALIGILLGLFFPRIGKTLAEILNIF